MVTIEEDNEISNSACRTAMQAAMDTIGQYCSSEPTTWSVYDVDQMKSLYIGEDKDEAQRIFDNAKKGGKKVKMSKQVDVS